MTHAKTCTALAALMLCAAPLLAAAPAGAVPRADLAPHKAIYNIKMIAKRSGSQVLNISGQMYFELRAGCDAWTTDHRFNLNYEYTDSPPMMITSDFTTYEPYAGGTLDFNSRRKRDGELFQELRGRAATQPGQDGSADYNVPEGMKYKLPAGTLFPMAHTVKLLDEIKAGKTFINATVFDGSDEEGPVEINAFVGAPVNALATVKAGPDIDATLINTPAHNLRMAFFPLSSGESGSDYEMNAVFHDNGIISDMTVEYGDFTVSQSLQALQKLEPEPCGAGTTEKTGAKAGKKSAKEKNKDKKTAP